MKLGSRGSTPSIPHYNAGALRLPAQTTQTRSPSLPAVQTFDEAGIKGLVLDQWLGVLAPAGTRSAVPRSSSLISCARRSINSDT
jgi:tripartite-type tricarboxylate transporter receptor subunit TctC